MEGIVYREDAHLEWVLSMNLVCKQLFAQSQARSLAGF